VLRWDVPGNNGTRTDYDVVTDLNIAQQAGASADENPVSDNWSFLAVDSLPECPIAYRYILKDDSVSLEHCLSIDDDAESVVYKPDAVVHHDLWWKVAGIAAAQPSLDDLRGLSVPPLV
jgi:hypothetical protein